MKIIKQNTTFINNQSGTDDRVFPNRRDIFDINIVSPYLPSGTGSYSGNVVEGNNKTQTDSILNHRPIQTS